MLLIVALPFFNIQYLIFTCRHTLRCYLKLKFWFKQVAYHSYILKLQLTKMALHKSINTRAKTDENTGFGVNSNMYGGRFINKDGSPDTIKTGIAWWQKTSWFHSMLQMETWKFLVIIFLFYTTMNLLFALLYFAIGVEHMSGITVTTPVGKFWEAFFFSAQSFTTVGYGRLAPTGFLMSFMASFEALTGLLSFALVTGLMYGRFSRPQAFIRFSENALIAPFKDTVALMLRLAPFKNNRLTDAEVKVTLALIEIIDGQPVNRFYPVKLELDKINALSLSWTVVHPIDENSPLYGLSQEDLITGRGEILVFVKAFDDSFSNTVVSRSSFLAQEIVFGAKFVPMFHKDDTNGGRTVMEMNKLNTYEKADISFSTVIKF